MGNSYINVNVYVFFHTKSTGCTIQEKDLIRVFDYIGGIIRAMEGHSYKVGGRPDHIHLLASLPKKMNVPDFVRTIKANSSRWIKELSPYYQGFMWQEGYGVFSVSESDKDVIIKYIENQKLRHEKQTASEEFDRFLNKMGFTSTRLH